MLRYGRDEAGGTTRSGSTLRDAQPEAAKRAGSPPQSTITTRLQRTKASSPGQAQRARSSDPVDRHGLAGRQKSDQEREQRGADRGPGRSVRGAPYNRAYEDRIVGLPQERGQGRRCSTAHRDSSVSHRALSTGRAALHHGVRGADPRGTCLRHCLNRRRRRTAARSGLDRHRPRGASSAGLETRSSATHDAAACGARRSRGEGHGRRDTRPAKSGDLETRLTPGETRGRGAAPRAAGSLDRPSSARKARQGARTS